MLAIRNKTHIASLPKPFPLVPFHSQYLYIINKFWLTEHIDSDKDDCLKYESALIYIVDNSLD